MHAFYSSYFKKYYKPKHLITTSKLYFQCTYMKNKLLMTRGKNAIGMICAWLT